ncbi:MAG: hypothetical protein K8R35_00750 [Bacteroidales bacterium]|nr:hypothetical protein [Bacteroidales bacterium]
MPNISVKRGDLAKIVALATFIIITLVYFSPVLEGKVMSTHDGTVFTGSSKEIVDFREEYNKEPLWTNSMFSGMPAYLISTQFPGNIIKPFYNLLRSPGIPIAPILLLMIGFYLLLISLKVNPWLAIAGAIAYGFSSYFFIILTAGHNTKAMALAYSAPFIGGVIYTYRQNRLTGAVFTSLILTLEIISNHVQITYYAFMTILIFGIFELIYSVRSKQLPGFIKYTLMLVGAGTIAIAVNFASLYTTFEYGKYSMRGKSELLTDQANKTDGLDRTYVTQWSYGIDETLTFLIPNLKGGASVPFDRDSETVKALRKNNASQYIPQFRQYWGGQTLGTSGPVYMGAIVFLLFIMGLVLIKGRDKWWLLTATILSIMLAWGKNFMFLTDLFLDYFPGYNKFRAVTMILVIAEFTMPLLAFLALDKIFKKEIGRKELIKAFQIGVGVTGGILLLYLLFPGLAGSFISPNEGAQLPTWLNSALVADRKMMLKNDVLKSLLLVLSAAAVIFMGYNKKLKLEYAIAILVLLIVIDMWPVNKRYLNNDKFITKTESAKELAPAEADNFILRDITNYRVLNLTVDPFNDGTTSYYHKSIGGYHGAKIRRYQDLIEHSLTKDISLLSNRLNSATSYSDLENVFDSMTGLNMLNTKYIILHPDNQPLVNTKALGNAWFVDSCRMVSTPDEEINLMNELDPAVEAVINEEYQNLLNSFSFRHASLRMI